MTILRTSILGAAVLAGLGLGGCSSSYLDALAMDETQILSRGWLPTRHLNERTVYCYRTLSSPECYEAPDRGETGRMIGHFGPPPEDQ